MISRNYLFALVGLCVFGLSSQQNISCVVSSFQIPKFSPSKYFSGVWYEQLYTGPATLPTQSYFTDYRQDFRPYNSLSNTVQVAQTYRVGQNGTCKVSTKDKLVRVSGTNSTGRYQLKEIVNGKTVTTNFWILWVDQTYQMSMVYGCKTVEPDGTCTKGAVEASFWSRKKAPFSPLQISSTISILAAQYCIDYQKFTNTTHSRDCGSPYGNTASGINYNRLSLLSGVATFMFLTLNAANKMF